MSIRPRGGLALLLAVGVLGLLGVLGASFVTLTQIERRASSQRLNASRAALLARSGCEDALARLSASQAFGYGGEDWDGSGALDPFERQQEVQQPGVLNREDCPARHALRPSFFARDGAGLPRLQSVEGRARGFSGGGGDAAQTLRVVDLNSRIHVNGGDLSPARCADTAQDGPNGFLLRLLDNLEAVVTGTTTPSLGGQVVGSRPPGGYTSLAQLRGILGAARFDPFSPFLATVAWVDPKVVRPQPVEGRPQRWLDIDAAHRTGSGATGGDGSEAAPWTRTLPSGGSVLDTTSYAVAWERDYIYAHRQLRLGEVVLEPRAPVSLNAASEEVLAAVFLGLQGTSLEVWEGSGGYDGGFGFNSVVANPGSDPPAVQPNSTYRYPSVATEETPWIRTRADYGMGYGPGATGSGGQARPWYGPRTYNPTAMSDIGHGGKPLPCPMPLGRLKETLALTRNQARALARTIHTRIAQAGPFRTWADFQAFVDRLPAWEDLNDDGVLDGVPYTATGWIAPTSYARRTYQREDGNSDGVMSRQVFVTTGGSWATGDVAWEDPGSPRAGLPPRKVPGLTFVQKDVLKAMANPNTDLNDFNPDAALFKEVDKTDLATLGPQPYVHTTELALDPMGCFEIQSEGRLLDARARVLARRQIRATARVFEVSRDTTQADFMRDGRFTGPAGPYPLAGGQPLVSYPEPPTLAGGARAADAAYDGQVGLGQIGTEPGPDETLRGDLFDTLDAEASGDLSVPDVAGPFRDRLVGSGGPSGSVFPDGVYSERDASLKFPMAGNFQEIPVGYLPPVPDAYVFYVGCWVKPNWFPEASPRPHALLSLSPAVPPTAFTNSWDVGAYAVPLSNILVRPVGLYFVPARNNVSQDVMSQAYYHSYWSTLGLGWPSRALLWGTVHSMYASDAVNRRGLPGGGPAPATRPVGRLEGHRWVYVTMAGKAPFSWTNGESVLLLGRVPANSTGRGNWDYGLGGGYGQKALMINHLGDPGDPNHLRFGELAAAHNMNYVADATFACVQVGGRMIPNVPADSVNGVAAYASRLSGVQGPAGRGRYCKEDGATYVSPELPRDIRPLRLTWTEVLPDLWFDQDSGATTPGDGWMGDASGYLPRNDQFGGPAGPNGLRDVRIDLELWDTQRRASFSDPGGGNLLPRLAGPLRYRARFVNEWDDPTRLNNPLDVTPFLDDVTLTYQTQDGPRILSWEEE